MSSQPDGMSLAEHELAARREVLQLLLRAGGSLLSRAEVLLELTGAAPPFAERDLIENALRDLVGQGLVHELNGFYFPTRPAVHAAHTYALTP